MVVKIFDSEIEAVAIPAGVFREQHAGKQYIEDKYVSQGRK